MKQLATDIAEWVDRPQGTEDRYGSWSCENVSAEGERRRHLNLACCPNCELESRWLARSAVSDLVVAMDTPMRTPHVWIAAMSGFTPKMFMTRVRL